MAGHKRLYVHLRAMHIIYTAGIFSNHRFHTIGKYVENYRYRYGKYGPDTDYRSITTYSNLHHPPTPLFYRVPAVCEKTFSASFVPQPAENTTY